jgi:hypothetical protein
MQCFPSSSAANAQPTHASSDQKEAKALLDELAS